MSQLLLKNKTMSQFESHQEFDMHKTKFWFCIQPKVQNY